MTLWLVHQPPDNAWKRRHHQMGDALTHRIDLDRDPAPTVGAGGWCGGSLDSIWLEEDAMARTSRPVDKPPYRVPLLAEIHQALDLERAPVAASTFTGAGGSCTGYELAGVRVGWASEIVPEARDTYAANHPHTTLDARDIRDVAAADVLEALGLGVGELDLLDGSPPCQSFSTAGKRERGWGKTAAHADGTSQRSDDLFFEFARLLEGLQPRMFVAENVAGLIRGVAKGYFLGILRRLRGCGYVVEARVLDAQWLGVPQHRERLIFVGVRQDLGMAPRFPSPLPYRYSVRDALPELDRYRFTTGGHNQRAAAERDPVSEPAPTIGVSGGMAHHHHQVTGPELVGLSARNGHGFARRELSADAPAPTVRAGDAAGGGDNIEILVGQAIGNDAFEPVMGTPDLPHPTIQAAGARTSGLIEVQSRHGGGFTPKARSADLPSVAIGASGHMQDYQVEVEVPPEAWLRGRPGEIAERLAPGQSGAELPETHGSYWGMRRLHPDQPAGTVQANEGNHVSTNQVHPTQRRRLTIPELRRICAFPDDYHLTGSYEQQWARLGNAVPPLMAAAVARANAHVLSKEA